MTYNDITQSHMKRKKNPMSPTPLSPDINDVYKLE